MSTRRRNETARTKKSIQEQAEEELAAAGVGSSSPSHVDSSDGGVAVSSGGIGEGSTGSKTSESTTSGWTFSQDASESSTHATGPDLSELRQEAMLRDGFGTPVKTEGGIHVAAGGAKDVAVAAVEQEVTRKLSVSGDPYDPRSTEAQTIVRDMATGLVDASLDKPRSTLEQQEVLVSASANAMVAQEKSFSLGTDAVLYARAGNVLEGSLKEGSSLDKLEGLKSLNQTSDFLSLQDAPLRPEIQYLANTLNEKVPDVSALYSLNAGLNEVQPMLTQEALDIMSEGMKQDLVTAIWERVDALPAETPNREELAESVGALNKAIVAGDAQAASAHHSTAGASLERSVDLLAERVTQSLDEPTLNELRDNYRILAEQASELPEVANGSMDWMTENWSAAQSKELHWGELSEPAHAFAAGRDAGKLRDWLGEAAEGFSDEDLFSTVSAETQSRATERGITAEDVQEAMRELQSQVAQEGRDPSSVDQAIALEALAGSQLEKASLDQQALSLQSSAGDGAQVEAQEAQAEMDMAAD